MNEFNSTDNANRSSESPCVTIRCICDEKCVRDYYESYELLTTSIQLSIGIPYVILIILSIIANFGITVIIIKTKRLRTMQNILVVNLAVSDIFVAIFCMPFTMIMILNEAHWTYGNFICKVS